MPDPTPQEIAQGLEALKLLNELHGNKDHSLQFQRMIKSVRPNLPLPQIDVGDPIKAELTSQMDTIRADNAALLARIEARDQKERDDVSERDLMGKIDGAVTGYRLTGEGRDLMIKRMKETGSFDPEAAAAWVADQERKATPAQPAISGFAPSELNLYGVSEKDDALEQLHTKPWSYFDKQVAAVLNEGANAQ